MRLLLALLLSCATPLCLAQEPGAKPATPETQQEVYALLIGHWVVDFDAAETNAFLTATGLQGEELTELKHEMASDVLEFQAGKLLVHERAGASTTKIRLISQDFAKRSLVAEFQHEDAQRPDEVTVTIDGDRATMAGRQEDGQNQRFGLKRISQKDFEQLKAQQLAEQQRLLEEEKQAALDHPAQPPDPSAYPTATPVADKPGFVFSPYNNKVIDVREIPTGTLVADPTFPASEKKYFRVP